MGGATGFGMIIATTRVMPLPRHRTDVIELFHSVQEPMRAQPGCISCDIYEEEGAEAAVILVGRWFPQEALETHLRSEMYRCILGAMELSGDPPAVRFERVTAIDGLELVERIRNPVQTMAGR